MNEDGKEIILLKRTIDSYQKLLNSYEVVFPIMSLLVMIETVLLMFSYCCI